MIIAKDVKISVFSPESNEYKTVGRGTLRLHYGNLSEPIQLVYNIGKHVFRVPITRAWIDRESNVYWADQFVNYYQAALLSREELMRFAKAFRAAYPVDSDREDSISSLPSDVVVTHTPVGDCAILTNNTEPLRKVPSEERNLGEGQNKHGSDRKITLGTRKETDTRHSPHLISDVEDSESVDEGSAILDSSHISEPQLKIPSEDPFDGGRNKHGSGKKTMLGRLKDNGKAFTPLRNTVTKNNHREYDISVEISSRHIKPIDSELKCDDVRNDVRRIKNSFLSLNNADSGEDQRINRTKYTPRKDMILPQHNFKTSPVTCRSGKCICSCRCDSCLRCSCIDDKMKHRELSENRTNGTEFNDHNSSDEGIVAQTTSSIFNFTSDILFASAMMVYSILTWIKSKLIDIILFLWYIGNAVFAWVKTVLKFGSSSLKVYCDVLRDSSKTDQE